MSEDRQKRLRLIVLPFLRTRLLPPFFVLNAAHQEFRENELIEEIWDEGFDFIFVSKSGNDVGIGFYCDNLLISHVSCKIVALISPVNPK